MDRKEFARGIALFNRAEFFEAHEVLEDIWRASPPENKKHLQGLVQVAVAFHHYSTGNRVGMRSVLERALKNLNGYPNHLGGIRCELLMGSLRDWLAALDQRQPLPPLPQIEIHTAESDD